MFLIKEITNGIHSKIEHDSPRELFDNAYCSILRTSSGEVNQIYSSVWRLPDTETRIRKILEEELVL